MNLEAIDLYRQSQYLNRELQGAIIGKIYMPNEHALYLECHGKNKLHLLCELGGNGPALCLINRTPVLPNTPPAFCMLLRKHFEEGHIAMLTQKNFDRVLVLTVDVLENGSKITTKELIFELSGHNSNILFVQEGKIVDCLKHIGSGVNRVRTLLPGHPYSPPPLRTGLHPLAIEAEKLASAINAQTNENLLKKISGTLLGIGNHTAGILAAAPNLMEALTALQTKYAAPPDNTLNTYILQQLSARPLHLPEQKILQNFIHGEINKTQKKIRALQKDLNQAEKAEEQKIRADTIMANIYLIHQEDKACILNSIYDGTELPITLNPELTPVQNAEQYYKRYNKLKRAQKELQKQLEDTTQKATYLATVDNALNICNSRAEIEEIRLELLEEGILTSNHKKKQLPPKSLPIKITLPNAVIYIGKNNRQNDQVTFKIARPQDLWFHTKDIPGSHVILQGDHSETNCHLAAMLAAYFSQGKTGSNIPVDKVERRYVKKPAGSPPGFVIFTNNRTSYINIENTIIRKLLEPTP